MGSKSANSVAVSDNEWARVAGDGQSNRYRGWCLLSSKEASEVYLHLEGRGWRVLHRGGAMMQFTEKRSYCLLCAEWALEGSRARTEVGSQLREMVRARG